MQPVAGKHKATLGQVAIAWVNQRSAVSCALVGAKTASQAQENAPAGGIILSDEEVSGLTAASEGLLELLNQQ
jgi:methylglyoxal reductase